MAFDEAIAENANRLQICYILLAAQCFVLIACFAEPNVIRLTLALQTSNDSRVTGLLIFRYTPVSEC